MVKAPPRRRREFAICLFAALSAIMLVTRRIDWYALGPRAPRPLADRA
jgi:inner membrane protein involved in colicin E2 resistance